MGFGWERGRLRSSGGGVQWVASFSLRTGMMIGFVM